MSKFRKHSVKTHISTTTHEIPFFDAGYVEDYTTVGAVVARECTDELCHKYFKKENCEDCKSIEDGEAAFGSEAKTCACACYM
jgi:hypothetical protein